jgi:hypothetical protein
LTLVLHFALPSYKSASAPGSLTTRSGLSRQVPLETSKVGEQSLKQAACFIKPNPRRQKPDCCDKRRRDEALGDVLALGQKSFRHDWSCWRTRPNSGAQMSWSLSTARPLAFIL